jgi:hypothetical protein
MKVRREREKVRKETAAAQDLEPLKSIYFDGRLDKTSYILRDETTSKYRKVKRREDHLSVIKEPGGIFVDHLTPADCKAETQASMLLDLLASKQSAATLQVVGCDGTNTNSGVHNGIIRLLEVGVGHPLFWAVCLLHASELPLRHLLHHLEGTTTGPRSFSGPIGLALSSCVDRPIVCFETINPRFDLPEYDVRQYSTDQRYMVEAWKAVQSGYIFA